MPPVAHWDDAPPYRRERGHLAGTWYDLGTAARSVTVGVKRIRIDPGRWSTPAHAEGADEEIFFVLSGSGISWQFDGESGAAYPVREGDCLVHLALGDAHTLRAGPDGLDVLAFGQRSYANGLTLIPRAGVSWLGDAWVAVGGADDHPWTREAAAGEPAVGELLERPASIVNVAEVEPYVRVQGDVRFAHRDVGSPAGSLKTGISHMTIQAGGTGYPPHCHSAEEELFVVLEGEGVLVLGDEEHPVRRGSVVSRPAATRVAHSFRAGESPLTYLAYGTREPNVVVYYPRSNKISFRGVGVIGRIEKLDYWEGEE